MATQFSSSVGLQKLEEQLTCPICLEHFNNPKILPCFHSFCLHCLEKISIELVKGSHCLPCPTCRLSSPVPDDGLATLPSSFVINNFIEVHGLMKKVSGDQHTVSCDNCDNTNANRYCKQCAKFLCSDCLHHHNKWKPNATHEAITLEEVASTADQLLRTRPEDITNCTDHNKPQEIFCETCQELICHSCTVRIHRDHDHDLVMDAHSRFIKAMAPSIQQLDLRIDQLTQAKITLINRRDEVNQQAETTKAEIDQMITHLKDQLDEKGKKLKGDVDWALSHKHDALEHQIKQVEIALGEITNCRDFVEHCVKVAKPHQTLPVKNRTKNQIDSISNTLNGKTFEPLELADIELVKRDKMGELCSNIGTIRYSLLVTGIKVESEPTRIPLIHQKSSIFITLSDFNDTPISIPVSLVKCYLTASNNIVPCTVTESSKSGQYNVTFTPITRGRHQLHITIRNDVISGCPININVGVSFSNLNGPHGIAVNDDGLLVVSEGGRHCITILDREGNKVTSFGSKGSGRGELKDPQGVALMKKGTILVADKNNHRIQEFTMEGECVLCVGKEGNGPLQFYHPHGIAIDRTTGQVFVVDRGNHRVQILNPDLTFRRIIGHFGIKKGEFRYPHDVVVHKNHFYVTDKNNDRVQKFTLEGQTVATFNAKTLKLSSPSGIAANNDGLLYVNNGEGSTVTVMTTDGESVGSVKKRARSDLNLQGITFDVYNEYFYICNKDSVKII